jgi:molybdate transport system permease protein
VRAAAGAVAVVLLAAVLAFLVLPVAAILVRVPPGDLWLSDPALDALRVSAETNLVANLVIVAVGTPVAYLLATTRFPGRSVVVTVCELPLVLPPAVAGIGLLVAFGRAGVLGDQITALGWTIPFTQTAVVLAVVFVAGPFYLRGAIAAFEAVDRAHLDAARTLGAGPLRVWARVALPLASGGLAASWALAFARGVGEFGATILVAGSLQGETQTLPLAVYALFEFDLDTALAVGGLQIAFAAVVLLAVKLLPAWLRPPSTSTSRSPVATSPSASA